MNDCNKEDQLNTFTTFTVAVPTPNCNDPLLFNMSLTQNDSQVIDNSQDWTASSSSHIQHWKNYLSESQNILGPAILESPLLLLNNESHNKRRHDLFNHLNRNVGIQQMNYLLMAQSKINVTELDHNDFT